MKTNRLEVSFEDSPRVEIPLRENARAAAPAQSWVRRLGAGRSKTAREL